MNPNPDMLYGVVRERQHADRIAAIAETRAREQQPSLQQRLAAMLRTAADRLDPAQSYSKRQAAETIIKRQLYYSRSLLARYDPSTGRVVYETAGQGAD